MTTWCPLILPIDGTKPFEKSRDGVSLGRVGIASKAGCPVLFDDFAVMKP